MLWLTIFHMIYYLFNTIFWVFLIFTCWGSYKSWFGEVMNDRPDDMLYLTSLLALQCTRVSISWLYPYNKSSCIRFVYSQCHVDWLKCTEQNVNNQNLTQVSQLYVHVSFCLKVIRLWHNLPTGGHGHVICMLD